MRRASCASETQDDKQEKVSPQLGEPTFGHVQKGMSPTHSHSSTQVGKGEVGWFTRSQRWHFGKLVVFRPQMSYN